MGSIARVIGKSLGDFPLDRHSCELLGPTALIVQSLMGMLAVLSLVYKRHRETQKRPWNIWVLDVSKQALGQLFAHGLNVLISDLGSHHFAGNACTYYFLNILFDTIPGIGLLYILLQGSTWVLSKRLGIKGLKTGQYGTPPSITYWIRQTAVYVFSITTMKLLVVALFAVWPGISAIGDWLLSWTTIFDGDSVQVIFVMGIFPIFMNIVQFWVIDSIVKASTTSTPGHSTPPRSSDSQDREPLFNSLDDDDDVPPQDVETGPRSCTSRTMSEGDFKTLAGTESDMTKLSASGSSSPITLPRTPVVVAHDYPPNVDAVSSQGSTRSRHRHRRSPSSLFDLTTPYSAPAAAAFGSARNSRQSLLSKSIDHNEGTTSESAKFDVWEKSDLEERAGGEPRTGRLSMQGISSR